MNEAGGMEISYANHPQVEDLIARLIGHVEQIALQFDRWEHPHVFGPGLYLALVVGPSIDSYADPMGDNRWPDEAPVNVLADSDGFHEALDEIAYERDGALVISVDGVVLPQFVRFLSTDVDQSRDYADWMGSRHMSALDISTRQDVVATLTLSQESGRITVFKNGSYETTERTQLGAPWRGVE